MLAGNPGEGVGEWGFAALLEADGQRWLIDTGARAETVLRNADELNVDLSTVTDLVITHNHPDHTGGLIALRRELSQRNSKALSRAHVAQGIFLSRAGADGREANGLLPIKAQYEALGGTFIEHASPMRLAPGVWLTGPVPRIHPERNWSGSLRVQTSAGPVEDIVAEDASVVVDTLNGLVVISGCGHAGMINTIEYARKVVRETTIHAAVVGFICSRPRTTSWRGLLRSCGSMVLAICSVCTVLGSRRYSESARRRALVVKRRWWGLSARRSRSVPASTRVRSPGERSTRSPDFNRRLARYPP